MNVAVTGAFDNLRSTDVRFLQESSALGSLRVLLWDDASVEKLTGQPPKFPLAERRYFLRGLRYVVDVEPASPRHADEISWTGKSAPQVWADMLGTYNATRQAFCARHGIGYRVWTPAQLSGFPEPTAQPAAGRKKVLVTGCYDWLHSGHVRFFEEASSYGDVYAVVGHDANIRALKGKGHPLQPQEERRYMVGSVRHVTQSLISSGHGWLDAEPEIARLQPHFYAVNEDGDRGGKRDFCARHGIEYLVLKRVPAEGLPKRSSTDLRGF
jgi:cytidyltransferase-like protein